MKIKAVIASETDKVFSYEEVEIDDPRDDEIRVKIKAVGLCHTDVIARDGLYQLGRDAVLGHEGAGVVVEVGKGVESLEVGDHVIPLYIPECRACKFCLSGKTNLCQSIRATQGKGLMPDATSRFSIGKDRLFHYRYNPKSNL